MVTSPHSHPSTRPTPFSMGPAFHEANIDRSYFGAPYSLGDNMKFKDPCSIVCSTRRWLEAAIERASCASSQMSKLRTAPD